MSTCRPCSVSTWRSEALALAVLLLASSLAGCGGLQPASWFEEDAAFVQAVPDETRAHVRRPPVTATRDGNQAVTLELIDPVADEINALTLQVLSVLGEIVSVPPDERTDELRRWGPAYANPYGVTYELSVLEAEGSYDYELLLDRGETTTATYSVLTGDYHPDDSGEASGSFLLDGVVIDEVYADLDVSGRVAVDHRITADSVAIGLDLTDLDIQGLTLVPDLYAFYEDADGGNLCFYAQTDLTGGGSDEQLEVLAVWTAAGAGRASGTLQGGDVGDTVSFTECWDASGGPTYWWDSAGLLGDHGAVEDCPVDEPDAFSSCAEFFPG